MTDRTGTRAAPAALAGLIGLCLRHRVVVLLGAGLLLLGGLIVAPFGWDLGTLPRDRVPVDAIPNTGDNQQIVFTEWAGRSPQDVDDQVTYPLTAALLGLPGVKAVRSQSMFGFSSIAVIFDDDVGFYWSRARILERLASLGPDALPPDATPTLGPDATPLGQVFWYTLEGRDDRGRPAGGWDLDELRSVQDWIVRQELAGVAGVAEVASIGGFVRTYQIDVDPDAMRTAGVTLSAVVQAVRRSNLDVGARTLEINRVEYVVRGRGLVESIDDLRHTVVRSTAGAQVFLRDIAEIGLGPAPRRGVLDKGGAEAVGGVVVARYGANPMAVIEDVKARIAEIEPGLPSRVLDDGRVSHLRVVPFYDRSGLISETLATLEDAIGQQVLVTIAVVVLMLLHLRSSVVIGSTLPLAVLGTFGAMKLAGVDANIVSLSGIAIAVGTIVDMGIVLTENIVRRLAEAQPRIDAGEVRRLDVVQRAAGEVGGAVLTASLTTIVSFLPVFALEGEAGRLFRPLAFTKTFAVLAAVVVAVAIVPVLAQALLAPDLRRVGVRRLVGAFTAVAGAGLVLLGAPLPGVAVGLVGVVDAVRPRWPGRWERVPALAANVVALIAVLAALSAAWRPLGLETGPAPNFLLVAGTVGALLGLFWAFGRAYPRLLAWALRHKLASMSVPASIVVLGVAVWLGVDRLTGWLPERVRSGPTYARLSQLFPGLGQEFMPALDEGGFLYMPTTSAHASIGEASEMLATLDMLIESVPEVERAVGKIGRAESAMDPAPISMVETIIDYKPEYATTPDGAVVRQWRDHIASPQDIWNEIAAAAQLVGVTSAPKLQPIETRRVMLQTGFRAPMGIKVFGPDLDAIGVFGVELERLLRTVDGLNPLSVQFERTVAKPYIEIDIDRERIARHGLSVAAVQEVIDVAIGGRILTMTVEGRERYPVQVRYPRERRDTPESLAEILVPTPQANQVPLGELATIRFTRGPEMIRSEGARLVGYVLFDRAADVAEVDAVALARRAIDDAVRGGALDPPVGVSWRFDGRFREQLRTNRTLMVIIPVALAVIFALLHLQFRSVAVSAMVFCGVFVAWGGGFAMLWLYGQAWFLDVELLGRDLRELLGVRAFNLSTPVWVGFLALFGIATDDGVVMATRLRQVFSEQRPDAPARVRAATVEAGRLRVRACLMTTATTILALLPVLTSTGRGADVMVPMALPVFGGMAVALVTLFVVPVLFCTIEEFRVRGSIRSGRRPDDGRPTHEEV